MYQEHSFFSQPMIFFGPTGNEEEMEEASIPETWRIDLQIPISKQPRAELFFHWYTFEE